MKTITPFLLLCPLAIAYAILLIINISLRQDFSIMILPQVIGLLVAAILLLLLDRFLVVRFSQTYVALGELLLLFSIYLIWAYSNRKLIVEAKEQEQFGIVSVVEPSKATQTSYSFPFNRRIKLVKPDQVLLLTNQLKYNYRMDILSSCGSYTSSGINAGDYVIDWYWICSEKDDTTIDLEIKLQEVLDNFN